MPNPRTRPPAAAAEAQDPPATPAQDEQEGKSSNGREPLLDFSEIEHEPIRARDGQTYLLRTAGLGAVEHHRLTHCAALHDELFAKETLTVAEKKRMTELLDEMLELILDAPKEVRDTFEGSQKRQIIRHFQRASQPDGQYTEGLAALLAQLQTEPETSSTTAS